MGFRLRLWSFPCLASMKALPKRKGNPADAVIKEAGIDVPQ